VNAEIRGLLDVDYGLSHWAAQHVVEDRQLHAGQPHPAADDQQHDEEEEERFHRAIMPDECKSSD
jgi:hypothetical protein